MVIASVCLGSVVVGLEDVDLLVVEDVVAVVVVVIFVLAVVVDDVFFSVIVFFTGSSSRLKKSRSPRNGRLFSVEVVVEETLDNVVVWSDDVSFEVVEFISWSIANHVKSWFLLGVVDGFSEIMSYSSGLTDIDSNDTTEPLPRMIEGCLIGRSKSKLSI